MNQMRLVHGSLFSGFDAPSVAASWMGWENAFHCEINHFCNEILKYWFPNSEYYEDITKTDFSQWKGRIDVLTGGFPCQPFSIAGKRKGADDNRYLWPHMLRAIREIRPTWVIGENVAGILTMVQPGEEVEVGNQTSIFGEDDRKRVLLRQEYVVETICKDLEREGYSVQPMLVPSERRTEETEFGLLPTVQTQGLKVCNKQGKTEFMPLDLLPTPMASDGQVGVAKVEGMKIKRSSGVTFSPKLRDLAGNGLLPTPTTRDYKGASTIESIQKRGRNPMTNNLADCFARTGKTSQLNPLFVEEMMGFPLMYTTLPFLSRNGDRNQSKDTETP